MTELEIDMYRMQADTFDSERANEINQIELNIFIELKQTLGKAKPIPK